jgi:hypothetical protein
MYLNSCFSLFHPAPRVAFRFLRSRTVFGNFPVERAVRRIDNLHAAAVVLLHALELYFCMRSTSLTMNG